MDVDGGMAVKGPGLEWANLLSLKGGPLVALLGYRGGSPKDRPDFPFDPGSGRPNEPVGEIVATEMGRKIAEIGKDIVTRDGAIQLIKAWLDVNGDHRAWNAVAMGQSGYWWIGQTTWEKLNHDYHIEGPVPIA
jgi:hypothetical protein